MTIFETDKRENLKSKVKKFVFNLFPAYRRSGGRICFLSYDWSEVHVKLGLNWTTKNYVGTVFGGSIYASLDPIFMIQLINILGSSYIVWDKSANIKFIRPIKSKVYAKFLITDEILADIKTKVNKNKKYDINLTTSFQDKNGTVYAEVIKTIYIADKTYYQNSKKMKNNL